MAQPAAGPAAPPRTRLAVSSRGDALTTYVTTALAARFDLVASVDAELSQPQRLAVALATFRPSRRAWVERFYKSGVAYRLRSRNVARRLSAVPGPVDLTFQVHALFEQPRGAYVIYVDCTHRQSAEQWPDWNPLRGRTLQRWYDRERAHYRRAAHVFAFSEQTRDSLVEDYGVSPERVTAVGAGVNFAELPTVPPRPAQPALPAHPPTVLFVGNDFVRKGGEVLVRAFARVREQLPDARLQIVGTEHPLPATPGVQVLGRIADRDRVAQLFAQASVFAVPSFFDPFPLVLLEAMAYGLPCVATPTCGVPEMVVDGESALLVAAGDEEQLAAALLALLQDPVRAAALGARARERAGERFLWPQVIERMAPVIDSFAGTA